MKEIVVGDIHLQDAEPKYSQAKAFLDWLFSQSFNNSENDVLFLGDLCNVNAPPEMLGIYVDYFVNKSKFSHITILQGNHDCNLISSILSVFAPLPNVEVITEPTKSIGRISQVFLPYYNHEGKDIEPMNKRYSNLFTTFTENFDFGFGHIEDETNHFSSKFPDTSKMHVKVWLNGHIHTPDIQNGGHYLGSPILNSVTESGKTPYIAEIDTATKEYKLIEVPKFMEYYEVSYPDNLPTITTPLALFLVTNSIDKEETIKFYEEQAKKNGYTFYPRRIVSKRALAEVSENTELKENTDKEYLELFLKEAKVENSIADICRNILTLQDKE